MIDAIKADFYQLRRSRVLGATTILFFIYVQLNLFGRLLGIAGNQSLIPRFLTTSPLTGMESLVKGTFDSFAIFLVTLVMSLLFLGSDLTGKHYQARLTKGLSRAQFFILKNITLAILSFANLLFYYGLLFVESSLLHGLGNVSASLVWSFLLTFFVQFLLSLAIIQFVSLAIYWRRSIFAGVVAFMVYVTFTTLPASLLPGNALFDFIVLDFNLTRVADIATTLLYILFTLAQTVVFGWFSLQIFKKQDL
ncbi:hypothetical protein [Streptococcus oricebi]|uniref:ABC-2 family transporter protein n=1 Tax=Streptococcus oricebi TaxID=1547447 RepID=A0ABS5B2T4_9STRE|nr:hypothetical protein [Streptococcus oricebi]MBP2623075.1 hypothetical protein [Streptococcus oricebi]